MIRVVGGIRHMVWDRQPEQLINNESVEQSSQLLIGGSLVLGLAATFLL